LALTPGTRLGPYEVTAQIGVGGMGEVYRATDTNLKRSVAIKVLPTSVAADAERLTRFQREAEVLAALNHPNIAAIYGLERSEATTALVMELVEGPTLADRIAQGAIPLDEALPIAKQVAEALEAAHEHGIIHRDLKPANIKLRPDATVKVLDFGLAKAMEPVGPAPNVSQSPTITTPAMTQAGMILGTAAYMSPEQARAKPVDKRTDIWAFGCLLFEMLTGRRAFMGEDVSETLATVLKGEPDWTALPTTTPPAIRSLLRRCLQRAPDRRLRDISDARFQIEDALNEPPAFGAPAPPGKRGMRLLWAGGALAVVVATAGATWYSKPSPPEADEVRLDISTPPTTDPTSIAISPDGRTIVFTALSNGEEELWLRSLSHPAARALPGTKGAVYLFWSPDSVSIGFFADAQLKRIDVESGAVQTLAANAGGPLGGAWNGDDTILFTPFPASPVVRIPATGGAATPMSQVNAEAQNHRFPRVLPDRRHFLYYDRHSAGHLRRTGGRSRETAAPGRRSRGVCRAWAIAVRTPGRIVRTGV
jgi:eukaryotic-like serine/threonine-protein kinase